MLTMAQISDGEHTSQLAYILITIERLLRRQRIGYGSRVMGEWLQGTSCRLRCLVTDGSQSERTSTTVDGVR
jgi:hypothetical protein